MDENIILAGILWKFLRSKENWMLLTGYDSFMIDGDVERTDEEAALLREIASRKDFTWADKKETD